MANSGDKTDDGTNEGGAKKTRKPLILGLIFAIVGAGAGFATVQFDLLPTSTSQNHDTTHGGDTHSATPVSSDALAFVPLEPLVINLPEGANAQHLLFTAQLEVDPPHKEEVTQLIPRIVDVLNGYLRSVHIHELEDPSALVRLRAQMLRRVQVVAGEGHVKDLLVMEFVLN